MILQMILCEQKEFSVTGLILNHLMAIRNKFEKQSKGNDLLSCPGTLRLSGTA